MKIYKYKYDINEELFQKIQKTQKFYIKLGLSGKDLKQDRINFISIKNDDEIHIVEFLENIYNKSNNLINILQDSSIVKIFTKGVIETYFIQKCFLTSNINNIQCIKILSKLINTYSKKTNLSKLIYDNFQKNIEFPDFFYCKPLTEQQIEQIAIYTDYLDQIYFMLEDKISKQNLNIIAQKVFSLINKIPEIYFSDWSVKDIIDHH